MEVVILKPANLALVSRCVTDTVFVWPSFQYIFVFTFLTPIGTTLQTVVSTCDTWWISGVSWIESVVFTSVRVIAIWTHTRLLACPCVLVQQIPRSTGSTYLISGSMALQTISITARWAWVSCPSLEWTEIAFIRGLKCASGTSSYTSVFSNISEKRTYDIRASSAFSGSVHTGSTQLSVASSACSIKYIGKETTWTLSSAFIIVQVEWLRCSHITLSAYSHSRTLQTPFNHALSAFLISCAILIVSFGTCIV